MRLPFVGALHEAHAGDNGTKFYFLQRDMLLLIIEKYFDVRALFFLRGTVRALLEFWVGRDYRSVSAFLDLVFLRIKILR